MICMRNKECLHTTMPEWSPLSPALVAFPELHRALDSSLLVTSGQWHWRRGTGFIRDWNKPCSLRITGDVMLRRKVACRFPQDQEHEDFEFRIRQMKTEGQSHTRLTDRYIASRSYIWLCLKIGHPWVSPKPMVHRFPH